MKYLLYYKLDSNFIADQSSVGGDGTKVVSVVDGVAWSNDQEKAYYRLANNDSENLTSYTVTVHYKSRSNKTLVPDDVYVVDAYVGKSVKETITAKGISGYTALNDSEELIINDNIEYTFYYKTIPDYRKPLTFNIISAGTIVWKAQDIAYATTIEYSKNNGETWTSITSNTGASAPSISVSAGDIVQFRGNNATYCSGYTRYNAFSGSTAKFEVGGNIMSLIDSENFATATTLVSSYTFYCLFFCCAGLTSDENLVLPATTLTENCYGYMFRGCTSLTTAPALPATTLAAGCYQNMLQGCSSLTTAPELPATTLAGSCYNGMFRGCTSLTTAPELPATTLASQCYYDMFDGCTSLTTAPALPATTLQTNCYGDMFYNCTSLTTAPELPATTLARSCYYYMFSYCTSLTTAPELPATTLTDYCYCAMFSNCTSLTAAPELPATTLANRCYYYMFQGCTSLTSAPELPATTLVSNCYQYMFSGCTNLNYIKCLATDISASYCTYAWVSGVASSGTFVKNPNMSSWTTGVNGIPRYWTVQDNV